MLGSPAPGEQLENFSLPSSPARMLNIFSLVTSIFHIRTPMAAGDNRNQSHQMGRNLQP